MMKAVSVLGTGLVGQLIARDLVTDPSLRVTAWDRSEEALAPLAARGVGVGRADLSRRGEIERAVAGADAVAIAVPGFLGAFTLRNVLDVGRPAVDISFSPEDPLELDGLARERGIAAVVDCGVAPGLSNLLVGRATKELDRVDDVLILVGGLPTRRVWPWEYRAVFSPTDVLEEYTRPCRLRREGVEIVVPALSDV